MLEVTGLTWVDDAPDREPPVPWSCRLSLWHRWVRVHVDGHTSYVECERCHGSPTPTIFDPPMS